MNPKSCCNRKICPRNQSSNIEQQCSSQKSNENQDFSGKETEISTENLEYHVDMSKVYECMEDAQLFRGCLMQIAILCQDIHGHLKRDIKQKSKCKGSSPQMFRLKPLNVEIPLNIRIPKFKNSFKLAKVPPQIREEDIFYSCESLTEEETREPQTPCSCDALEEKNIHESKSEQTFLCQCSLRWNKAFMKISQSEGALHNTAICQNCNSFEPLRKIESGKYGQNLITFKDPVAEESFQVPNGSNDDVFERSHHSFPQSDADAFHEIATKIPEICDCGREKLKYEDLQSKKSSRLLFCEAEKKCACDLNPLVLSKSDVVIKRSPPKLYRKALPQHKDVDVCIKCRFDPSPLIDEEGRVFCPGNCGCCLCAWTPRATTSLEDVLKHTKIKVCKCRNRGTIFEDFGEIQSICSQISYFDICPCREKVEAKHLELYGIDMWHRNERRVRNPMQGEVVLLLDVRELRPDRPGSTRFLSSKMFNEI
ncbi:uncharacterized protein [Musca autumnalis]|uniref:uncharacterized protein n=1 Tax=Musca autumnalis TaxID=221902 RepID=UPI003CF76F15